MHDVLSVSGAVYCVELDVGSAPFVVYRMVAPEVLHASATWTDPVNVPPFGVMVGVATAAVRVKVADATALSL